MALASDTVTQVPAAAGEALGAASLGVLQVTGSEDRFCMLKNVFSSMLVLLARTPEVFHVAGPHSHQEVLALTAAAGACEIAQRSHVWGSATSGAQQRPHLLRTQSGMAWGWPVLFSGQITISILLLSSQE